MTILFEDTAALVSLGVAAAGLWLTDRTGNGAWDAAGSGLIGLVLLAVAVILAVQNYSLLLGETAAPRVHRTIRQIIMADGTVVRITGLRTMHLGPRNILIVLRAEFAPHLRGTEVANAVARIERRLGEVLGDVTDAHLVVIELTPRAERSVTAGGVAAGDGRS